MCGILATLADNTNIVPSIAANAVRGRDAWGYWTPTKSRRFIESFDVLRYRAVLIQTSALACCRAEPTTEWVRKKSETDIQPYEVGDWVIVHNGTIANDKELLAKHQLKSPTRIDSWVIAALLNRFGNFNLVISMLIGSYAICAINKKFPREIHFAMNYRPLYLHKSYDGSTLSSVAIDKDDRLLPPYSIGMLDDLGLTLRPLLRKPLFDKALVVCSGGLDSTVAATALLRAGMQVELLHFDYGCRATHQELKAIHAIAAALRVKTNIVQTSIFTDVIKGSPLTNTRSNRPFAESEAGAEFAHEWVPARNLIMLSLAVGIAESRGFNVLALGANLEEAGAYPDNEPEFYNSFSRLLPFAVRDGAQLRLEMPVGNLMKHEIVSLGLGLKAPLELTWSCYNNGSRHCGHCGPCFMRRTAFEINGAQDPVFEGTDNVPIDQTVR